jgi:hypothetical protein
VFLEQERAHPFPRLARAQVAGAFQFLTEQGACAVGFGWIQTHAPVLLVEPAMDLPL